MNKKSVQRKKKKNKGKSKRALAYLALQKANKRMEECRKATAVSQRLQYPDGEPTWLSLARRGFEEWDLRGIM